MLKRWRIRGEIKSEETVKSFLTCRCPVRQHRAHPVTCVWRATPVTAATSTTAGSEYTERSSTWQNSESVAYSLCLVAWICLMCTALPFYFIFFALQLHWLYYSKNAYLILTFVSENILLWDFRIKMFWKSLGNHPWFGSRSLFSRTISAIDDQFMMFFFFLHFFPWLNLCDCVKSPQVIWPQSCSFGVPFRFVCLCMSFTVPGIQIQMFSLFLMLRKVA